MKPFGNRLRENCNIKLTNFKAEQEKRLKEAQENRDEAALETITENHEPNDEKNPQNDKQVEETDLDDQVKPVEKTNSSEHSPEPIGDQASVPEKAVVEE